MPGDLDEAARPGVRVKVRFAGQDRPGYLLERRAEAVLDGHHADRECHRVHAHVVDQSGVPADPADVDVQVVAQDCQELRVHRFGL